MLPHLLDTPAAWIGFISSILGIIAFFLPSNSNLVIIDQSTNFYFPEEQSKSNNKDTGLYIFFSFLGIFLAYSKIHNYFFTITSVLFAICMWKYRALKISYTIELINGVLYLVAAFLIRYLPIQIANFWNQLQTINSKDLYGSKELVDKFFQIFTQIFTVFTQLFKGNYLAYSLMLEFGLVAIIFGHFLSVIFKKRKDIKPTRKVTILESLVLLTLLLLLIIYLPALVSFGKIWINR
jgi:hypothetical protein